MRKNILMIDDDPDAQELIKTILCNAGFNVFAMHDGFAALDELQHHCYDLLLLDLSMPHLSGFRILHAIRTNEKLKNFPVVILTARSDIQDVTRALHEANDYILKPPKPEDLISRLEKLLINRPPAPQKTEPPSDTTLWKPRRI